MKYMLYVNKVIRHLPSHIVFMLCVLVLPYFPSAKADESSAFITLSPPILQGGYLKDGDLITDGKVLCTDGTARSRLWMASDYLSPDRDSYVVYQINNMRARLNVKLKGDGWSTSSVLAGGIINNNAGVSTGFNIVANGDQYALPGDYILSVAGECFT
ncbi:AfaD family invasin [Aeromonas jandaei]|uniref:AfaD family invasin n=1 Tax=Aeromonas jandaei TaxID=650 RepID=UPI003B9E73A0